MNAHTYTQNQESSRRAHGPSLRRAIFSFRTRPTWPLKTSLDSALGNMEAELLLRETERSITYDKDKKKRRRLLGSINQSQRDRLLVACNCKVRGEATHQGEGKRKCQQHVTQKRNSAFDNARNWCVLPVDGRYQKLHLDIVLCIVDSTQICTVEKTGPRALTVLKAGRMETQSRGFIKEDADPLVVAEHLEQRTRKSATMDGAATT
jgi:hypothetical protein